MNTDSKFRPSLWSNYTSSHKWFLKIKIFNKDSLFDSLSKIVVQKCSLKKFNFIAKFFFLAPPLAQATLMTLFKMLSMRAQGSEKFADLDAMIDSRKIEFVAEMAKGFYSKLKEQNVFLETSAKELDRWIGKNL